MPSRVDIEPCPFCGNGGLFRYRKDMTPEAYERGIDFCQDDWGDYSRLCRKCYASGPNAGNKGAATKLWNERAESLR